MIKDPRIDEGQGFDWGRASSDYAKYRDIYPAVFYEKILSFGLCRAPQRVLDLGTGTGVLPRAMHKYGAHFTATDISKNQIEMARALSEQLGMDDIAYIVCATEQLTFDPGSFDTVTAAQCFFYFDESVVPQKLHSFLKPGGHLLIAYMDWLPFESEIARASEQLVLKHNPSWNGHSYVAHKIAVPDWASGLFRVAHNDSFAVSLPFTRESWAGRMRACRGVGASALSAEAVAAFEVGRAHV